MKIKKVTLLVGIGMVLIGVATVAFYKYSFYKSEQLTEFWLNQGVYQDCVQEACSVVQCVTITERITGETVISNEDSEEMKSVATKIFEKGFYEEYPTKIIAQMLVIDDYFDLGYKRKLQKEILERKSSEDDLFFAQREQESSHNERIRETM